MADQEDKEPRKLFGGYHEIVLLVLGFALTSILGGFIGAWFQQRGWDHQKAVEYSQSELSRASETFESLSRTLDRRLYRTRLVLWDYKSQDAPANKREEHKRSYSEVLNEWNENLNRNLALTERYFGTDMRSTLELVIIPKFVRINDFLQKERRYDSSIEDDATNLSYDIYAFNLGMLTRIQQRQIGNASQDGSSSPPGIFLAPSYSSEDIRITAPYDGAAVNPETHVEGRAPNPGSKIWTVVHPVGSPIYWVQGPADVDRNGTWKGSMSLEWPGHDLVGTAFEILSVANPRAQLTEGTKPSGWPDAEWRSQVVRVTVNAG